VPVPGGDDPLDYPADLGGGHRGQIVIRTQPDRVQQPGPASPAGGSGRAANRVTARTPDPAVATDRPVASCQRAYRLASSRSQSWGIPSKLKVASGLSMPRLRSRQRAVREFIPVLSFCDRVDLWCYGRSAGLAVLG